MLYCYNMEKVLKESAVFTDYGLENNPFGFELTYTNIYKFT